MAVGQEGRCGVEGPLAVGPSAGVLEGLAHAHGKREEEEGQQQEAQHVSAEVSPVCRTLGNLGWFLSRSNHNCVWTIDAPRRAFISLLDSHKGWMPKDAWCVCVFLQNPCFNALQKHTLTQINRGLLAPNCFNLAVSAHMWPRPQLPPPPLVPTTAGCSNWMHLLIGKLPLFPGKIRKWVAKGKRQKA